MRIVHAVRSDALAGVERYVLTAAGGLAERGHEVVVVGTDIQRGRRLVPAEVVLEPASRTSDVVRRLMALGPADVVHAHLTAAEVGAVITRPWHRAPVVATRHLALPRGQGKAGWLARQVARGLAAQVAISQYVADATGEAMPVLYSGVPDDTQEPRPRRRSMLVLSRLEPEKAVDVALAGFADSGIGATGWVLEIAGEGSLMPALRRLSRDLGIEPYVRWLGFVPEPRVLLREVAALLAPTPREGLGLAVLEAMATGTPVLADAGGAHPEVLAGCGIVVSSPLDTVWGQALRQFSSMPAKARAVQGRALQARQREAFSLRPHLDGLEALYTKVAGG